MSKFDSLNDTFNTDDSVEVDAIVKAEDTEIQKSCLLYTSPSPRDRTRSRMPSSA